MLEVRWTRTASVAQLALVVLLVGLCRRDGRSGPPRWVTAGAVLLLLLPAGHRVRVGAAENRAARVTAGDLQQPLYRDVAAALRASQPEGPITLLASPNASAGIANFGRFRAVGTLFWENAPGLRAAAEIFSADSDEEAFRRVAARGITHLVLLSSANFLGEYHRLLRPGVDLAAARRNFGHRLLAGEPAPGWLQAIPYRAPPELREAAAGIRLFRVRPDQNPVDHLFFAAVAQVAAGDLARAERTLEAALGDVPPARRPDLLAAAGSAFRDYGADAAAARCWRHSLGLHYHAPAALAYAWTLATSREASVRDGLAALSLAEPLARANPADAPA